MTLQQAQQQARTQLRRLYEEREAANIADWALEHVTGKKRIDRLVEKEATMPPNQQEQLRGILEQLLTHKPVQYVLGEAWFCGQRFFVNEHVLIPRPETEELVEWVSEELQNAPGSQNIIDIGTGSGCIPVSIKKKHPLVSATGIDVSEQALEVAKRNANTLLANIQFLHIDFLNESAWSTLPLFNIITSNPPYIKQSEESQMSKNVLAFEPALALFVPDEDALLFYRKIARFSKTHLQKDGKVFLEINEAHGRETVQLFENEGFDVILRKDLQGKDRMIKTWIK